MPEAQGPDLEVLQRALQPRYLLDPVAGRRHAFWSGRLGEWLFRMAMPRSAPTPAALPPTPSGND